MTSNNPRKYFQNLILLKILKVNFKRIALFSSYLLNVKYLTNIEFLVLYSFINKDYKTEYSINVTDWMGKSNLLPLQNNFDKLLKGFLETPGRLVQPSYNYYVIMQTSYYILYYFV